MTFPFCPAYARKLLLNNYPLLNRLFPYIKTPTIVAGFATGFPAVTLILSKVSNQLRPSDQSFHNTVLFYCYLMANLDV
jgi:hypothetical protein